MNDGASTTSMNEPSSVAAVSRSEPVKQAEARGGSSRSVPVVAFEEWRTETEGNQSVAKEHTRKKEEPLMGKNDARHYTLHKSRNLFIVRDICSSVSHAASGCETSRYDLRNRRTARIKADGSTELLTQPPPLAASG